MNAHLFANEYLIRENENRNHVNNLWLKRKHLSNEH